MIGILRASRLGCCNLIGVAHARSSNSIAVRGRVGGANSFCRM
jgi:hypothetical protein